MSSVSRNGGWLRCNLAYVVTFPVPRNLWLGGPSSRLEIIFVPECRIYCVYIVYLEFFLCECMLKVADRHVYLSPHTVLYLCGQKIHLCLYSPSVFFFSSTVDVVTHFLSFFNFNLQGLRFLFVDCNVGVCLGSICHFWYYLGHFVGFQFPLMSKTRRTSSEYPSTPM